MSLKKRWDWLSLNMFSATVSAVSDDLSPIPIAAPIPVIVSGAAAAFDFTHVRCYHES